MFASLLQGVTYNLPIHFLILKTKSRKCLSFLAVLNSLFTDMMLDACNVPNMNYKQKVDKEILRASIYCKSTQWPVQWAVRPPIVPSSWVKYWATSRMHFSRVLLSAWNRKQKNRAMMQHLWIDHDDHLWWVPHDITNCTDHFLAITAFQSNSNQLSSL